MLAMLLRNGDAVGRGNAENVMLTATSAGELLLERAAFLERYDALSADASGDERVPVVDALAHLSNRLGDWPSALQFGTELLVQRLRVLGADHPGVLSTRSNVAFLRVKHPVDDRTTAVDLDAARAGRERFMRHLKPDT